MKGVKIRTEKKTYSPSVAYYHKRDRAIIPMLHPFMLMELQCLIPKQTHPNRGVIHCGGSNVINIVMLRFGGGISNRILEHR